jgi:hypothetical protein
MPYAMPPQSNTNSTNGGTDYSHVQLSPQGPETSRAHQAAINTVPDGSVLDVTNDGSGRPIKAHVRDAHGRMHTLTFDASQHVTNTQDGYC